MKKKAVITKIIAVLVIVGTLCFLQRIVMPKHVKDIIEGSLIEEYYAEKTKHDVLFIGDCEVYENFSPITLWQKYGITSYIRGSAQQLIWQSYYLLEETLKYEKPEVVVFNILAMKYDQPQKEAYNRMTLDGMKLSASKIRSISASMMPDEKLVDYLFPILRYHSRWSSINSEDWKYLFGKDKLFHNGYYMRADVKPVLSIPVGKKLPDYQFGDNAYKYLDKMVDLCKTNSIKLVFIKAPTIYPYWYDQWEKQMVDYSAKNDIMYVNFLKLFEETGIDLKTDTYDAGLHMNLAGAEKLSTYFGAFLQKEFAVTDRRNDSVLSSVWQEKVDFYEKMKAEQYAELEKYGYLKSLGAPSPLN